MVFISEHMKFGKRLRRECHTEWEHYYLDYKELKKIIKGIAASESGMLLFIQHYCID